VNHDELLEEGRREAKGEIAFLSTKSCGSSIGMATADDWPARNVPHRESDKHVALTRGGYTRALCSDH
jgi:hypothetical protein